MHKVRVLVAHLSSHSKQHCIIYCSWKPETKMVVFCKFSYKLK